MALINNVPGDTISDPQPTERPPRAAIRIALGWVSWFQQVFRILTNLTLSGTTAQRPTQNLWIGQPYFDTTLMAPVYVESVGPPVVWVPAANGNLSFTWSAGTTAQRPSTALQLGQMYFDTTLGQPIWCSSISPIHWVNAAGVQV
jgi:hypothetical protein